MTRPPLTPPVSLTGLADPLVVGNKFSRLADTRDLASVPEAWCVPVDWFPRALGPERLGQLGELFAEIAATLGHEAALLDTRVTTVLDGVGLSTEMRAELAQAVMSLTDGPRATVAVRSSTTVEDGELHSHAGLYESYLHLADADDVQRAVVACWRSFYSPRAILGRVRAGDVDPTPRMAVIVQRMVDARLAGVAFTQDGHTIIEAIAGTGDRLVAGLADASQMVVAHGDDAPAPFAEVARLAEAVQQRLEADADIEWASDGDGVVHLLQARPVTTTVGHRETGPFFTHASLYFDDTLPPDLALGDCTDVYLAYTAKRAPLYRLAATHGTKTGNGWVVALNGQGLADTSHHPAWWRSLTGQVVIDLGANLRQHILPADELPGFLTDALNLTGDLNTVHPLIVRQFVQGEAGIITHRGPDGRTIIEHAPQGLLAINRGLTEPQRQVLPPLDDHEGWAAAATPDGWAPDALTQLAHFTQLVDQQLPGAHAEWVLNGGRPQFLDVSILDTATTTETTGAGAVISPGTARGPLLHLDDSEELTRLSVAPIISVNFRADAPPSTYITQLQHQIRSLPAKPIVHARRPYVILSLLIDDVAGFVFDGGSLLCHLAILLREAHTPAIITPHPLPTTSTHTALITNGHITLTTTEPAADP